MFRRNQTPRHYHPPGYDETLNRHPPTRGGGCLSMPLVLLLLVLAFIGVIVWMNARNASAQSRDGASAEAVVEALSPTPTLTATVDAWSQTGTAVYLAQLTPTSTPSATPTSTPTLDAWSLTGTALYLSTQTATPTFTATMDYCWFLSPTPLPTIYVTPDTVQVQATQDRLLTGTPLPTAEPTQAPPRAWCDRAATAAPAVETTDEPYFGSDRTLEVPFTPPPTWTLEPVTPQVQQPRVVIQREVITSEPDVIVVTRPVVVVTQKVIVITATLAPETKAPTWELPTETPTLTLTPTETASPTLTPTNTDTPTETPTNTDVPPTATETWTLEPPTFTPTPTETPSETPTVELIEETPAA